MTTKSSFALDADYINQISLRGNATDLRALEVPANGLVPNFHRGDRAIFDMSASRVTQSGTYVYWNGFAASVAELGVSLGEDGKPVVSITEGGRTVERSADKVKVFGKVVAFWGRV